MDREIDFFAEERVFQLFNENALSTDVGKAGLVKFVASRLDNDDFGVNSSGLQDLFADKLRLPAGEDASARSDSGRSHGFSRSFRNKSRKASTFWIFLRKLFSPRSFSAGRINSFSSSSSMSSSIFSRSSGRK